MGLSAVTRRELRDDREAYACAGGGALTVAFEADEVRPDALSRRFRDAWSFVIDFDSNPVLASAERDTDSLTLWPVLDRVIEQVDQDLSQRIRIDRRSRCASMDASLAAAIASNAMTISETIGASACC